MNTGILIAFSLGLLLLLLAAGCTSPQNLTPVPPVTTPPPTPAVLVPSPTDVIPQGQRVVVSVSRGTLSFKPLVKVEFRGGEGMIILSGLHVILTKPDGTIETGDLAEPAVGDFIEVNGSTGKDRIEVFARYKNGNRYKIYDQILEFRG